MKVSSDARHEVEPAADRRLERIEKRKRGRVRPIIFPRPEPAAAAPRELDNANSAWHRTTRKFREQEEQIEAMAEGVRLFASMPKGNPAHPWHG
ncbi:MAG: hypothetical protein F4Y60_08845 [Boseongicola sp. SB0664_bin_43]|uniref:Uncharacterized protein n=1 Tax=Boseongicola sp. SB0664_bin_43 TaxID=2604844 RepID=A0A6B0Y0E0_9RHOB|nr:hypothetical protein [Boseongicola sp. SB0664_bin_43]